MKVIIMRGLPGSGKTAYIDKWLGDNPISKLDWLVVSVSQHVLEAKRKGDTAMMGRGKAFKEFISAEVFRNYSVIFIDGVNAFPSDYMPYVTYCMGYDIPFEVWRMDASIERCAAILDAERRHVKQSDLRNMDKHLKAPVYIKETVIHGKV